MVGIVHLPTGVGHVSSKSKAQTVHHPLTSPVPLGTPAEDQFQRTATLPVRFGILPFNRGGGSPGPLSMNGPNGPRGNGPNAPGNPGPTTYDGFVKEKYVNDRNETVTGGQILKHLVAYRKRLDSQPGQDGVLYGSNPGRRHDSAYFSELETVFGFSDPQTLRELVGDMRNSRILKDNNAQNPNAPADVVLTDETVIRYKQAHMSTEAKDKLQEMVPRGGNGFGGGGVDADKKAEYVRHLVSLPWGIETEDTNDVAKARTIFDERFYGLEQLKSRILQKIAVRQLKGGNRGAIFLLVGPGGTGKTAIAKSIAEAVGREYVRVSLAGVTDPNKINGHSYTYVGSRPGMIAHAMKLAGTVNPVIQLDEIDKTGSGGNQGDPKEALLAVLDPDQNKHFKDSYLDVEFDLSKAIFVCTANSLANFPEHFLSRVEIIEFPAYLEEEKVQIAQKHLVPEKEKAVNIPKGKVEIDEPAIRHTIRKFTREGGVRKLAARIVELLEQAGIMIVSQKEPQRSSTAPADRIKIGEKEVDAWLDNPYPIPEKTTADGKVGQVNGLYYSIVGGGRLPIQVQHMPGRGRLTMTGSLRDVMKESAQVALSYIQSHTKELGLPQDVSDNLIKGQLDIHIHYPDTATPKDGPSAGISTFLALYSALSGKEIPQNIGLTGEVGLHGEVMPIGGVKEKISGAFGQGVTQFILPESNRSQVEDAVKKSKAFETVFNQVTVHYVKTVTDVVKVVGAIAASQATSQQATTPSAPGSSTGQP